MSWTCCISEDCWFEFVWSGDTQVSTKLNFVWVKPQRETWWKINRSLKSKVDPLKISDYGLSQNVTISSAKRAQHRNVHTLLWKYNLIVTRASKKNVIHSVGDRSRPMRGNTEPWLHLSAKWKFDQPEFGIINSYVELGLITTFTPTSVWIEFCPTLEQCLFRRFYHNPTMVN